jgi:hypothetical protein
LRKQGVSFGGFDVALLQTPIHRLQPFHEAAPDDVLPSRPARATPEITSSASFKHYFDENFTAANSV